MRCTCLLAEDGKVRLGLVGGERRCAADLEVSARPRSPPAHQDIVEAHARNHLRRQAQGGGVKEGTTCADKPRALG